MPTLDCSCGATLNVGALTPGEILRCPKCQSILREKTPDASAVVPPVDRDNALRLFQAQYATIFPPEELRGFTRKSGEERHRRMIEIMPRVLSAYEYQGEFFPCVNYTQANTSGVNLGFGQSQMPSLAEDIFLRFFSRTGRAALLDGPRILRYCKWDDVLPWELRPMFAGFSIICPREGCRRPIPFSQKNAWTVLRCSSCGAEEGMLICRLLQPDFRDARPSPGGVFRTQFLSRTEFVVEADGIDFRKPGTYKYRHSPARKYLFSQLGMIYVNFGRGPGTNLTLVGNFEIKLYDHYAQEIFKFETGDSYHARDAEELLVTIVQHTNVPIYFVNPG